MKALPFRRVLSVYLCVLLLFSSLSVSVRASGDPAPSGPASTEETSLPGEPLPETPVPEASTPGESIPEASTPGESVPEESTPEESIPEESVPSESTPEESIPDESIPEESTPEESVPGESTPEESIPDESAAGESVPEESAPDAPQDTEPLLLTALPPENTADPPGPGLYFGQLHTHSAISEGTASPEELYRLARENGLDFFAVTDHGDSFDGQSSARPGTEGSAVSQDWASGKQAAAEATSSTFVGIYGFEMSWPHNMQLGHIGTFATPGFQSWMQAGYDAHHGALERYYDALASLPEAIGQFNHPGKQYGTFNGFSYDADADRVMALLEVGSGTGDGYRYYTKALDQGWHLAPSSGSLTDAWTVADATALTESAIYDAIRNSRVYTTGDKDLEIRYTMDGYPMGSRLALRHIGNHASIQVSLSDPTDAAVGRVEVISKGGKSTASQTLSEASGTLTFSLEPDLSYYFLRITQPDGDVAVTAPIWVDAEESLGISALTCQTPVPVQGEAVALTLSLYNQETVDFNIDTLEILADDAVIATLSEPDRIPACHTLDLHPSVVCQTLGTTRLAARLTGTLEGSPRTYTASLSVSFRQSPQVTGILVDGIHQNAGLDRLALLEDMAAQEHIRLDILSREPDPAQLAGSRFLLVTAPALPFSQTFVDAVAEYAAWGGSVLLCGQAGNAACGTPELNRLLAAMGSSLRIGTDPVLDPVLNGGSPDLIHTETINRTHALCGRVTQNQVYRHASGCSVDPGRGTWLVRSGSGTLLAAETLSGGGTVLASGSLFLSDDNLADSQNIWDEPYANRAICQTVLGIGGDALPLSSIREARASAPGTLVRIRGYATAGTSNAFNTFPDTLYIQDDTGGIAVVPFQEPGIQAGTPLELTGCVQMQNGNVVLKPISREVLRYSMYQYLPATGDWQTLLDPGVNGGRLVQVEGTCREVYCHDSGILAGFSLKDKAGTIVRVLIEETIGNGSDGENDLHLRIRKGRTVRAAGLLHTDELGNTVIRVRNCEEVVYVPPRRFPYLNPRTGDPVLPLSCTVLCLSAGGLLLLKPRKKR